MWRWTKQIKFVAICNITDAFLWNDISNCDSGLSPLVHVLQNCKVFGYVDFVLDLCLQDGHKNTEVAAALWLGQFLDFSKIIRQ